MGYITFNIRLIYFIAYMMNSYKLTDAEKYLTLEAIKAMYDNSELLPLLIKFNARSLPFKNIMSSEEITKNVKEVDWGLNKQENLI